MNLARFGVTKPVPVNLLMIALLLAGTVAGLSLRREFFPESDPEMASVALPYPGATPEEIEQTMAKKVEDRLIELDEVDEITTNVSEGGGSIVVRFQEGVSDVGKAVDEVERAVDSLLDLPDESERIVVTEFEPRMPVIMVTLFGDADEWTLKETIRTIRDELRTLPGMGELQVSGVRDYELRVDVDQNALLQYGLSLTQVSAAIRSWMADIPGGTVRSGNGNINVRTIGVDERAHAIEQIVLWADPDGLSLRIGDIADVRESFVDELVETRFNGKPSASLIVFKSGDQDIIRMANMVKAYVAGRENKPFDGSVTDRLLDSVPRDPKQDHQLPYSRTRQAWLLGNQSLTPLPDGTAIALHTDLARFVDGRLRLLIENASYGCVLVFLTLLIFLNWRGALWVGVGLVTAMAGTLVLMVWIDTTLNLLTMFGLIIVIGLLVDDAIVVAENIQSRHDRGEPSLVAAIRGADQVKWPVVATVLTSIVAFLPLTFVQGQIGTMLGALPIVVTCALIMSLVESLLILPSHMGHSLVKRDKKPPSKFFGLMRRFEQRRDAIINNAIIPIYAATLATCMRYRYIALSVALSTMIVSIGFMVGGRVPYVFLPESDSETVIVDVSMPIGTPMEMTREISARIEEAAQELTEEVRSVATYVGVSSDINTGSASAQASHVSQLFIELSPTELRDRESPQIIDSIRDAVADEVRAAERVRFSVITGGPAGADITVRLRSEDESRMAALAAIVKLTLSQYEGVNDIADDSDLGQRELQVVLKPGAAAAGFDVQQVATQVRAALFGIDAHVFSSEQEDIDVRVRFNETTRQSLYAIENLWLVANDGSTVPLSEIAELTDGESYTTIRRIDRERSITITASTASDLSPEDIVKVLPLKEWQEQWPDVDVSTAGRQEQQADAMSTLPLGFLAAMIMIYAILAWLFSNYVQPLAVMLGIPFATIGVIWGHWLLEYELTFLSAIGFVALSGIVVNDSLILVTFYNEMRDEGLPVQQALIEAGRKRFRPIFLTTVTTVLGLTPLMLEESFQAKFLIPMAIAISFGLMSATVLILLLLPCLLVIIDDIRRVIYFLWHGEARPETIQRRETVLDVVGE